VKVLAPAKLNLFLEIKRRLPDGYHALESVMQTVSLYDEITIVPRAKELTLSCSRPDLPTDEKNLALRAAYILRYRLGIASGAHIALDKRIPLGAGLGGGSSDAAAVLKGLLKVWKKRLPDEELVLLAKGLGADVPFFLKGGAAIATGIGEVLTPVPPVKDAWFVLVYPGFEVSSRWAYQNLHFPLTNKQKITKMRQLLETGARPEAWGPQLFNRLEQAVLPKYPKIQYIKDILAKLGCRSLMSGSGSTVFGLVSSRDEGERIQTKLRKYKWGVWVVETVS
jgi:4-diphosphocytidyl-2-C-methyl-D-erythritol kinase